MKIPTHLIAALLAGLAALFGGIASAQTTAPTLPPVLPSAPASSPPAPDPSIVPQATMAEGVLMKSQRGSNDRGKFEWICSYRIAGTTRSVQVDESCPQTMRFALKR